MTDETASWTNVERRDGRKYGPAKGDARAAALLAGKPTYMGVPCHRGHSGERYTRSRDCCECRRTRPVDQMSVDQLMVHIDEVAPEIDWTAPSEIDGGEATALSSIPAPSRHPGRR
jgi:hypothetical protein